MLIIAAFLIARRRPSSRPGSIRPRFFPVRRIPTRRPRSGFVRPPLEPAKGHKTYPYLLGGLRIDRPNQVWCNDITYSPMRKGFLYLVAIMDWFTRKVLAWHISNTREADFCLDALNAVIHKFGPPEIMNSVRGAQFTSFAWTDRLKRAKTKISMPFGDCLQSLAGNRWQSPIPRQHLHRAPLAVAEV